MSPVCQCSKTAELEAIRRQVANVETTLPNFDALLPELAKIHQGQGEILARLTGVEEVLEATVRITRNLGDELATLTPEVRDLASWRGEGQTREIEALRGALREQEREHVRREVEAEKSARERTKLRYGLAKAVLLAVISAAVSLFVGKSWGTHVNAPAPAAVHSAR